MRVAWRSWVLIVLALTLVFGLVASAQEKEKDRPKGPERPPEGRRGELAKMRRELRDTWSQLQPVYEQLMEKDAELSQLRSEMEEMQRTLTEKQAEFESKVGAKIRESFPDYADLVNRLEELRKKAKEMLPEAPEKIPAFNGFDKGNRWVVEAWANPADLSIVTVGEGSELKVAMKGGDKGKTALGTPARLDLSTEKKMLLDVTNGTDKEKRLAVAFATGQGGTYFESAQVTVKPGKNPDVCFDLAAETFKNEASEWKHKVKLENPAETRRVIILIYGDDPGEMTLDNIRFSNGQ